MSSLEWFLETFLRKCSSIYTEKAIMLLVLLLARWKCVDNKGQDGNALCHITEKIWEIPAFNIVK